MAKEIKVTIEGCITDYNIELFNQRLAITLEKELGTKGIEKLIELLKQKELESNVG